MTSTYVGSRAPKLGGARFLTGEAEYLDALRLPGTVHLAVVRSTEAHARIAAIETGAAASAPGVLDVLTGEQAARLAGPIPQMIDPVPFGGRAADVRCLALGKVVYAGEPVAAVVAETEADAAAAAALVEVE